MAEETGKKTMVKAEWYSGSGKRKPIVAMTGYPDYLAYLHKYAGEEGVSIPLFLERAVKAYAKKQGYQRPPIR